MKEYLVNKNEEGFTLHKYLQSILPGAGSSLLYKQLRKKNINLNGKKAQGTEKLLAGDRIQVFFSEATIEKFENRAEAMEQTALKDDSQDKLLKYAKALSVLYEDDDILALDKPAGMLTQKAEEKDISLNEVMLAYLRTKGNIDDDSLRTVKPSVCNRLDRNTSGIVLCGKSMKGLQSLSALLKERDVHKYYYCLVKGKISESKRYEGYLTKNEKTNKVTITKTPLNNASQYIATSYKTVKNYITDGVEVTLLEVLLETGRAHQIRAHLSSLGHPIVGDPKYGDLNINRILGQKHNFKRQLLHAARVEFPDGLIIKSPLPEDMRWLPGSQEV